MIRHAYPADLDMVAALDKEVDGDLSAPIETFQDRLGVFPEGFYVVLERGRVVGYIMCVLWNKEDYKTFEEIRDFAKHHDPNGNTLYIIHVGVSPKYRLLNIATQLLMTVIDLAYRLKLKRVELVSKPGLEEMYCRFGFKKTKLLKRYIGNIDAWKMEYKVIHH